MLREPVNIFGMASTALRGALWMLGAVLSFSVMAVSVRELLARMEAFEVLFWRVGAALVLMLLVLPRTGLAPLRTRRIGLHFTRNAFHFFAQLAWIYAIGALPFATVFAIEFVFPVWVALLAMLVLGERMNRGRVVMLVLGLAGVLVILRPGFAFIHPAAFVMLAGSLGFAVNAVTTKQLSRSDSTTAIIFWMLVMQTPPALIAAAPRWVAPQLADLPWICALGLCNVSAHLCLTRALRLADASLVVPIDFLRLPLIALIGALFYGEPLQAAVFIGAAMIFAGSYYSLSRER
jgi:drug/metabolite transporter (DMT)-like permease